MVDQVRFLTESGLNIDMLMVQFTHINRQGTKSNSYLELNQEICIQNFVDNLRDMTEMLTGCQWCWMLMDYSGAEFPQYVTDHPNKLAIDPDIIDNISVADYEHLAPTTTALAALRAHPGPLWHLYTARDIINFMKS
jgi:hypothetical protein